MYQRAKRVLGLVVPFVVAGVITWVVSWGVQYICTITIAGQRFDVTNRNVNRLAFATVVAVIVIAVAVMIILSMNGFWLFVSWIIFWPAVVSFVGWAASVSFPGTPVATPLAKVIYGIAVLICGIIMWYIFLEGVTETLTDA